MGWGDELMAAGDARRMMRHDPRRVEIVDRGGCRRQNALWHNNPRIARPGEVGNFQRLVNGPGARPYHTEKQPQRWRFNLNYRATPAEIVFSPAERELGAANAGRLIFEPHVKDKASPNKQWGWVRWSKLCLLARERGHRVTQLGPAGIPLLDGADQVVTHSFREACAVLATAQAAVLPEGGLHHAAAAVGLPAVVIFGGFTPVEVTGYDGHVNLGAQGEDACGMRIRCTHCESWMARITPEKVLDELEAILERNAAMARPVAA